MAAGHKIFKAFLIILGLVNYGNSQMTFAEITQNFCQIQNPTITDNLSCPNVALTQQCFNRDQLCNGPPPFCSDGADEGNSNAFSGLDCNINDPPSSTFNCGSGITVPIAAMCDGHDNCTLVGGNAGEDETNALCDNKCLLPYYAGCSQTRICDNSRFSVSCGGCLSGFVEVAGAAPGAPCIPIAMISFNSTQYIAEEGVPTVSVCVQLTSTDSGRIPITTPLSVTVTSTPGTAATPADYSLQGSSTVALTTANNVMCVTYNIIDDTLTEVTESFTVGLTIPTGNQFQTVAPSTATVLITDNDQPIVGFQSTTFADTESNDISVTAVITNGVTVGSAFSVQLTTLPSTPLSAVANLDYTPLAGAPVTFNPGSTTATVTVTVADDALVENTEQFTLSLTSNNQNVAISPTQNQATGNILDNDNPSIGFSPTMYTFIEADVTVNTMIVITNGVTFGPGVTRTVTVSSSTAGLQNPATAGADFTALVNQQITVSSSPTNIPVTLMNDNMDEVAEAFNLILVPGPSTAITAGQGTGTITITDDDLVEFIFETPTVTASEGDGAVEFCVMLQTGVLTTPITVTLNAQSGTATVGTDVSVPGNQVLTFPAGATPGQPNARQCIFYTVVDDALVEGQEVFTIAATTTGNFPNGATATFIINDNDGALFEFANNGVFGVTEGSGPATVTLQIAGASGTLTSQASITVTTLNTGTATAPGDFTATVQTLMFASGSGPGTTQQLTIPIMNDAVVENPEVINVQANIIGGGGMFVGGGTVATATVNVNDDDQLSVNFQFPSYTMTEGMMQSVCLVVTNGMLAPGVSLQAQFSTSPSGPAGSVVATPGMDYNAAPNPTTVTFTTGNPIQCTNLDIMDDDVDEPQEVFTVSAVSLNAADLVIVAPTSAPVFITDNDLIIFQFAEPTYTVTEGAVGASICVNLTTGIVGPGGITINVQNIGGSATVGTDFAAVNQALVFPAGTTPTSPNGLNQRCFTFSATLDQSIENPETVILNASSTSDVQFNSGGSMATVTLIDSPTLNVRIVPPPGVATPSFTINEGGANLEVCVEIVGTGQTLERPVTLTLSTQNGMPPNPAMGNPPADFQPLNSPIVFMPGQEGAQICRNISIIDDQLCEFQENFGIVLSSNDPAVNIQNSPGSVNIVDNDVALVNALNVFSIPENIGSLQIPLTLQGQKAAGRDCVVSVTTLDGSATNPADYNGAAQTITLNGANPIMNVLIDIVNDRICEGNENFQVFLTTSSDGCGIANGSSPIDVTIQDDEIGTTGGDDPHFSIVLPGGKMLCYTVQGEHGFSFNLIANERLTMNAKFVPDSRRSEVTWMGSMGIIVKDNTYKQANATNFRFEARSKKIFIGDKVELAAKNLERLTFKNGKLTISEAPPVEGFRYPSIYVDLKDVEIAFTMKFMSEHLDIFWHKTGDKTTNSHGIIGQFFRKGVEIDEVRKILIMPNKEPVPVMRRPLWSFMEREIKDDQLCWTAMNPGYQGEGLIDGTYFDYLVDDVMTSDFQFKKKQ